MAINHSYFVVMINFANGLEAIVDPEITRREVISRIKSGEYPHERISFIHHIEHGFAEDVTIDILEEALRELQAEAA